MRKIRVAFFVDCLVKNYDGAIRTMYQLIDRIPKDEFEFLFVTGDGPQHSFPHRVIEVPSVRLPINQNYKISLGFLVKDRVDRALGEFNPDVIHIATPSPLGHYGLKYAEDHGLRVISIYHTHFLSYVPYYLHRVPILIPAVNNYMISLLRDFYNACDLVYVPTIIMSDQLSSMGVFRNHLKIWKRGLDHHVFSPSKRNVFLMREITGNNKPNILFASRLVWEKNLKALLAVYTLHHQSEPAYNFIIAGNGPAKDQLEKDMPKAFFLGNLSHNRLSALYASCDVFLFPSVSETYGNVIPEAMASGLPCVIADGGGTTEFIKHGSNGFICNPDDPEEYLKYIDLLLHDDHLRASVIQQGIISTSSLSWEVLARTYFTDIAYLSSIHRKQIA